ncbi:MAG: hypothetical protein Q8L14_17795 [Myxococcales bacterium]|nr:hypothetical protein [Myxococcales bacterium]
MSDERLKRAFDALNPSQAQRVRVEERVVTAWESRSRSLFWEWLDVLRARPVVNGAWVVAAMAVLVLATPVGAILGALTRAQLPPAATSVWESSSSARFARVLPREPAASAGRELQVPTPNRGRRRLAIDAHRRADR